MNHSDLTNNDLVMQLSYRLLSINILNMGANFCCGNGEEVGSVSSSAYPHSVQAEIIAQQLCQNSKVVKGLSQKLDELTCTDAQLDRLAATTIENMVKIQTQREPQSHKQLVQVTFHLHVVPSLAKRQQDHDAMSYCDILEQVNKELKERNETLSHGSDARIYHSIAHIKRDNFTPLTFDYKKRVNRQDEGDQLLHCEYKFKGVDDMDETVRMEELAELGRQISIHNNIVLEQLQQQTQSINELLSRTKFKEWSYSLDRDEVIEVAAMAREATQISHDGVILLIAYLRQAMNKLAKEGKSTVEIEGMMKDRVDLLSGLYPPGQGLNNEEEGVQSALQRLEIKGQNKGLFKHEGTVLSGSNQQRTRQVRDCILHYAGVASSHQAKFQEMIGATCLKLAISVLTGLKLSPNHPNEKAVMRIQEKLFFKGQQYAGEVNFEGKPLDGVLKQEEVVYQRELGRLLEKKQEVVFSVSDTVRGKCTFTSIRDIIQVVRDIRQYCEWHSGFRIIEIESRFGLKVPISDVTMKIALDEQIVAELQLTLQTNAAAYHFAHIVYEISRSKIFSKCKMIDNMFRENEERIAQLINRSLALRKQSETSIREKDQIRRAFGVQEKPVKLWQEALATAIDANINTKGEKLTKKMIKEQAGDLMAAVIDLQKRNLDKDELKSLVNKSLAPGVLSEVAQTVLLQQVMLRINLAEDMKSGYYRQFQQYIQDLLQIDLPLFLKLSQKSCILELYISELAQTHVQNYRFDNRRWQKGYDSRVEVFLSPVTDRRRILSHQLSMLVKLTDAMNYLQAQQFQKYSAELLSFLKQEGQTSQHTDMISGAELRLYEAMIASKRMKEPEKQQFNRLRLKLIKNETLLVEWELWNTLLKISSQPDAKSALNQYRNSYQRAKELSRINLVSINTPQNSTVHWKIAKQLQTFSLRLEQEADKETIIKAQQQHHRQIATCGVTPRIVIGCKLSEIITEQSKIQVINPDQNITELVLYQNRKIADDLSHIAPVKWPCLQSADLHLNPFSEAACSKLAKASWPSLKILNLRQCQINDKGVKLLVQAQWPNLQSLDLGLNHVGDEGCQFLIQAQWPKLSVLDLHHNPVGDKGCQWLSQAEWPQLSKLILDHDGVNLIGESGCSALSKAKWPQLVTLNLDRNSISEKGCFLLSKGAWPRLQSLSLCNNNIKLDSDKVKSMFKEMKNAIVTL